MVSSFYFVTWIVYIILCLIIYHKLFNVVYFDFGKGFFGEIISASIAGLALLGLTIYFWWVVDIIIALIALGLIGKCKSNGGRVFVVICAIALGVSVFYMGTTEEKDDNSTTVSTEVSDYAGDWKSDEDNGYSVSIKNVGDKNFNIIVMGKISKKSYYVWEYEGELENDEDGYNYIYCSKGAKYKGKYNSNGEREKDTEKPEYTDATAFFGIHDDTDGYLGWTNYNEAYYEGQKLATIDFTKK